MRKRLIILSLFLASCITLYFLFTSQDINISENDSETEKVAARPVYSETIIENGTYINQEFGFQFNFDDETFNLASDKVEPFGSYWTVGNYKDFMESSYKAVVLDVLVRSNKNSPEYGYEQSGIDIFETIYTTKDTWSEKVVVSEVKTYELENGRYLTYKFANSPNYGGEHGFAYILLARKDDGPVIDISIMSQFEDKLIEYIDEFDLISNTFKFTNNDISLGDVYVELSGDQVNFYHTDYSYKIDSKSNMGFLGKDNLKDSVYSKNRINLGVNLRDDEEFSSLIYEIKKDANKDRYYLSVLHSEEIEDNRKRYWNSLYVLILDRQTPSQSSFFEVLNNDGDKNLPATVPFFREANDNNLIRVTFSCVECEPPRSPESYIVKIDFQNKTSEYKNIGSIKNLEWGNNSYYSYIPTPQTCLDISGHYEYLDDFRNCVIQESSEIVTDSI